MVQPSGAVPGDDPPEEEMPPKFEEAEDDDLELDVHMEGDETVGTLTAKGKFFRPGRAEAIAVSDLIRTFAVALYKIALSKSKLGDVVAPTDISVFEFASAHITFVAGKDETFRIDGAGSPTAEAAEQITNLMQTQGEDLLALAQQTGPEGAKAYKQFMRAVGQVEDVEVTWAVSGEKMAASITSGEASKAFSVLDREGEPEDQELESIPGHLSMADAGPKRFKLVLPSSRDFDRPTPLKGKKVIEGQYDAPVGDFVMEKGLWNKDVIATIRIEREKVETVAAPRNPKFHLVAVEPVIKDAADPPPGDATVDPPTLLDEGAPE
jgi:hypothetical protein